MSAEDNSRKLISKNVMQINANWKERKSNDFTSDSMEKIVFFNEIRICMNNSWKK